MMPLIKASPSSGPDHHVAVATSPTLREGHVYLLVPPRTQREQTTTTAPLPLLPNRLTRSQPMRTALRAGSILIKLEQSSSPGISFEPFALMKTQRATVYREITS